MVTLHIHFVYIGRGLSKGPDLLHVKMFNMSMSRVQVVVKWVLGDINYFKFCDFKKKFKVGISPIGKMYISCAPLQNAHTC